MTTGDPISAVRERLRQRGWVLIVRLFNDPANRRRLLRAAPPEEVPKIKAFFRVLDEERGPAPQDEP